MRTQATFNALDGRRYNENGGRAFAALAVETALFAARVNMGAPSPKTPILTAPIAALTEGRRRT
jgi:hypothetical protein